MRKVLLVGMVSVSALTANAQVHQCKVNGSVVFQDKPCAGTGKTVADQMRENREIERLNREREAKREQAMKEFNSRPAPYIGMPSSVISSWGHPDKVNRTTTTTGVSEQWVFRRNGGDKYLYFRGGKLTSISE